MYLAANVRECDFTGRAYMEQVAGAHVLAPGATGRWCWVMCAGPEVLAEQGIVPMTYDEAVAAILADHPEATIDFS